VTDVLSVGENVWSWVRSTRYEQEEEVVPVEAVAQAVARFLESGGEGQGAGARGEGPCGRARRAARHTATCAALIDGLTEARAAVGGTTSPSAAPAKMSGNAAGV
jgi:hypothetical protein